MDLSKSLRKNTRSALGRGLTALVSSSPAVAVDVRRDPANTPESTVAASPLPAGVAFLPLEALKPNPTQPRTHFSEQDVSELSESIKILGVLQPILVRPQGGEYQIVAGERRFRAASRAGLTQVPVIIKEIDDRQTLEVALVENVQRQNLNPLEEAKGYQRLMDEFSLSAQEVSERVGKDRATVANLVRILRLPVGVQEMIADGRISVGHAKAILTVKEPSAQTNLANKVIAESLSVRALEAIVSRVVVFDGGKRGSDEKESKRRRENAVYPELEERLRNAVGTKVSIHRTKQGGSIELHFFSDAELDRLVEILSAPRE
jgi:ParB family chromosome partitioning protein